MPTAGTEGAPTGAGSSPTDAATHEAAAPPPAPAAYVTTDDLAQTLAPVPLALGDAGAADAVVTVDAATQYQTIVGFGAASRSPTHPRTS